MEENKGVIFSRPPRFLPEIPRGEIEIPAPPSNQNKPEISWLSILLPPIVMIAVSVLMAMFSGSLYVLITIATTAVTILVSLVNASSQIKKYKKYVKARKSKYLQLIADIKSQLSIAKEQQVAGMNEIYPTPEVCVERLIKMDSKLWERTPAHRDFLSLRLGLGSIPSSLKPVYNKSQLMVEEDPLQEEPEKLGREFEKVDNLPVCLEVLGSGISGIAGTHDEILNMLRVLTLQMLTHHSYHDMKIVLIIKEEELHEWEWIKAMPHIWDDDMKMRFILCGSVVTHNSLAVLNEILKDRELKKNKDAGVNYNFSKFIFIVTNSEILEDEQIGKYLFNNNSQLGVSTIFTADTKEYLPMNCNSVVTLQGKTGTYASKEMIEKLKFNVDTIKVEQLEKATRHAAGIRLKKTAANFELPKSITLLEVMKAKKVEEINLMHYWENNKTYEGMGVPIGARAGNELFNLDMQAYETSHGPHGLVAGTTGSGKSELLQSIIISLAINFHPYDVVFVLIDYKGGGMADVFKGMPHLVGTITNLGGNQTTRALLSIKSELKRRQTIFSQYEVNNIDKYQKLYHAGVAKEPLPHLIMIADEFAELKAEQPEFMKELVSTARVGRSLGVHLILATQKPAGVVDDQIWSNSRFKICLKVQDEADSRDVIKRPDAAMIKEPGRAYIQVGNDEIFEMFQSMYSGADYDPEGKQNKKNKKKKIFKVGINGQTTQIYPLEQEYVDKSDKESQLKAMVMQTIKVAEENNIVGLKGPWMPPLKEKYYLEDVLGSLDQDLTALWGEGQKELIALTGIFDDPSGQRQEPLKLNFTQEGNLCVYGGAGTGKTTFVEGIMMSLAYSYSPKQCNFYILDFGGGSLKKYSNLPHCGGVISVEEEDKLNQFILFIFRIMEERKQLFEKELVANLSAYNETGNEELASILVIIDNYYALSETYEEIDEKMLTLTREGTKYGIYTIITANSPMLVRYKMNINFKMAVTMQLTDAGEYSTVVGRTEGLEPDKVLGRGLVKLEYPVEFQGILPCTKEQSNLELLKQFRSLEDIPRARMIPEMPHYIDITKVNENTEKYELVIGLRHNDLLPAVLDIKAHPAIIVSGEMQSGKSTALVAWTYMICQKLGEENVQLFIYDSQDMGLYSLTKKVKDYINLADDQEEMAETLNNIIEERKKQQNEWRREGQDLNELLEQWQQVVIVIDNIIEFAEAASFELKDVITLIAKKGYGLKITIIAGGEKSEYASNWEDVVKAIRGGQIGVLLASIKEQDLFNVRLPYGYYERALDKGDGYIILKNEYEPIHLARLRD